MTDQEYLTTALAQMHTGQWYSWKKENENKKYKCEQPYSELKIWHVLSLLLKQSWEKKDQKAKTEQFENQIWPQPFHEIL